MTYILRLGKIQTKIETLQSEVDTLQGGSGSGSGSGVNAEVQAAINNLQTDLDSLESQYLNLLTQYSNLNNSVTTIDGEVNTLQSELNIVETLHTDLNNEVTIIGNELDTLRSSHITLQSDYTTVNTKANSIQSDLDTLESSHTGLISQYNTLNTRTTNTQNDFDTLESSHATLQSAYTTVNNKVTVIDGEVDTLQSGYTNLSSQITTLDTQLDNLEIEVDNLIASVNSSGVNWSDITPATIPTTFNPVNHNTRHIPGGTDIIPDATTTISGLMSNSDKNKLNGIATQATLNSTDAFLLNRTNHTGSQAISTITSLQTSLDAKEPTITSLPVTKGGTGNTSIAIDNIFYASATNTLTATPITSYVRTLLDDIDASTFRTTLGLGTIATQGADNVNITGGNATLNQATITTTRTAAIQRSVAGTMLLGTTNTTTTLELGSLSTVINVGTGAVGKTINIGGHSSDILNITGSVVSQNVTNTNITDKLITINKGGAAGSADGSGHEIEENSTITGYFKIGNTRNSFDIKTPARDGILRFTPSTSAFTHEILATNTAVRTFTLPDADINLNSQAQNLIYASPIASTGAMSIRALVGNDIPLSTQTTRGAISREASGTFTPTFEGGTTAGTQTYNARIGTYYLIGKICVATIYIELATKGAGIDGNATIGGLPFTTASGIQSATVSQYAGVTFTNGYTQLSARIEASSNRILLFQGGSGVGSLVLQAGAIATNFVITITAAYITS